MADRAAIAAIAVRCGGIVPRAVRAIAIIIALILNACAPLRAQEPDVRPYESEDDLWEAFREGEITEDEYLRLREVYRIGTDSVFLPATDWEELPGSGVGYLSPADTTVEIAATEQSEASSDRGVRIRWRNGFDGRLSSPTGSDGYVTGHLDGSNWRALVNWRQDGRGARWQRRVFEYRYNGVRLQAGNVEPRWGRGLVVGRRSRLVGAKEANRTDGDFIQPALSRFNGLWVSTDPGHAVAADVLLSDIRSPNLSERMAGVQLRSRSELLRIGFAALTGTVSRRDMSGAFATRVIGGHVRIGAKDRALLTEIAMTDDGASAKAAEAVWRFERGRFYLKAWSYSLEFVNPWGGGPAHSDRESIELPEIGETYSSRTTGERGFSLSTRLDPQASLFGGRATARWEWMTHREAPSEPLKHAWAVQIRWRRDDLVVRPFVRGKSEEDRSSLHAFGFFSNYGTIDRRVSGRFEAGRHHVDADRFVRAGLGAKWRLNATVRLEPAVRWVDPDFDLPNDGYWYIYFTEAILPSADLDMEASLVWQRYERRSRGDVVELRLRAALHW
jgi:hypothetical protein